MSSTRRLRTNYLFSSGTSITAPNIIGVNTITTSNLSAITTTSINTNVQSMTIGTALYLNNSTLYFNKDIEDFFNPTNIYSNNGPQIRSYNGGILATGNGSKAPLMWDNYGNISINTTSAPQATLDVNGTISNVNNIFLDNQNTLSNGLSDGITFWSSGSYQLSLYNYFDGTRNKVCGINVSNDTSTWGRSTMYMSGGDHIFYIDSTTGNSIASRGTEVLRIKSTGVGIGTSNPQYKLHAVCNKTALPIFVAHTNNGVNHNFFLQDDATSSVFAGRTGAGALYGIYGAKIFSNRINGGSHYLVLSTGSLFNNPRAYLNFPNDTFILTASLYNVGGNVFRNDSKGYLGFGCSSTQTNNWFISNDNSLLSIYNGKIESPNTPILQTFRSTTGNLTGVSIGNFTTNISVGNVSSVTSGSVSASYLKSLSGSFIVSATGTYNITPNAMGYVGTFSCYFDQFHNGVWSSMADVIMPNSTTLRGNVSNIKNYTYNGNAIVATLQPFSGSNTMNTVSDSPANSLQLVVTTLSSSTTFYWTLTMYAEII